MDRPGRNEPCPCGSGKKYKKCCALKESVPESSGAIPPELVRFDLADADRRARFGEVRPAVHVDFDGRKFVGVGQTLMWGKWKTFPDFLFDYIAHVLGTDWGNAELKKSMAERHTILQWYDALCRFQRSQTPGEDGICEGVPDGSSMAYYALAYDLYVLRHHLKLQERLVRRLKHPDQFQGARYELFVVATCIRAGFEVEYEDESDVKRKHHELVATHTSTNERIAVEAKSRHRPGVLGRPGFPSEEGHLKAGVERLLRAALEKPTTIPRAIFIDLNYPPAPGNLPDQPWLGEVVEMLRRFTDGKEKCPWNCVVMTNHPYHYGTPGEVYPGEHYLVHASSTPEIALMHPDSLDVLIRAVTQFGVIPNTFPDEFGRVS